MLAFTTNVSAPLSAVSGIVKLKEFTPTELPMLTVPKDLVRLVEKLAASVKKTSNESAIAQSSET